MRCRALLVVLSGALILTLVVLAPSNARAQDTPPTGMTTPHIIPRPNSGHAPTEAGDRGGALQLGLLGLLVVSVSGAVVHLVRQSRRARSSSPQAPS